MSENPFEKMLKEALGGSIEVLDIGGQPEQPEQAEKEELTPYPKERLHEGTRVEVQGIISEEDKNVFTVRGTVRGVAPLNTPFGPMGFDYVILLDEGEKLPMPEGHDDYEYSCITAPQGALTVLDDEPTPEAEG